MSLRAFCRIASAVLVALTWSASARGQSCAADLNGDGQVNGTDLSVVLAGWGPCGSGADCDGDINGDGSIDGTDLTALLAGWGECVRVPEWATLIEAHPDPSVVTDAALRAAITSTGYAWRVQDTATQIEMVLIPPGTFQMGCSLSVQWWCDGAEFPRHPVTLTNAFYLGRYEVTQAQWTAQMGSNPSWFRTATWDVPQEDVPKRPVESVSWNTVQGFLTATAMRLPTEAEWEYAYRAGTTTAYHSMPGYPSGTGEDSLLGNIAWTLSDSGQQSRPVGRKAGNGFGLYDMSGNVCEWVSDWHSPSYYASSPSVNPPGPSSGTHRVWRGGSGMTWPFTCRSSARYEDLPTVEFRYVGFRVARAPAASPPALSVVTPASGPAAGGTTITLAGANLTGATSVTVGGVPATSVKVISETMLIAVTPAGTAGASDVTVTTPTGAATLASAFTYIAAPILTSVSPSGGPSTGGTTITLTGANLTGTTSVTVGGVAATDVQVVSPTTVTAVTPAGTVGSRDVNVVTAGGAGIRPGGFTYWTGGTPQWATLVQALPDPAVVTSATLRAAIVATGFPWRVRHAATQIEMVLIPGGTFQMGCSPSSQHACAIDGRESPVHTVTLTQPFYMGRYEVTQAQWTARMGSNPSWFQSASAEVPASQVPTRPVEAVSWNTIQGFLSATGMRLPTEAEWEYAYRAGTTTAFHGFTGFPDGTVNDSLLGNIAWHGANAVNQTRPVGLKAGNGFGLHDMAGNVSEWVNDWYSASYYASSPSVNPPGPSSGTGRGYRGGGYLDSGNCRASYRAPLNAGGTYTDVGFRVARSAAAAAPTLSSVSPASGPAGGGTAITLTGTNLTGTTSVTVGGVAATNVQVVSATTVTAVTPPGTAGARDVRITTPDGTIDLPGSFTYIAAPTLSSVSPASGPAGGGTVITLTGTNLTGTTSVTVGGVAATNVQVVSATTVTAVTPPGTAGARDVRVTTPGGSASRTDGFTYGSATVPSWATLVEPLPNPDLVTDATLRAAITATGYAWRVRDTATQIELVLIPPGTFQMGCSPSSQWGCLSDESPVHTVTLTNALYMGRFEVTQAQWTARMGSNPSFFQAATAQVPTSQVSNRPVERVSWDMIQGFLSATGMRLPTEAEWEYAYRAGTTTAFHSMPGYPNGTNDDALLGNIAWIDDNAVSQTRPVGQKAGNGFGLHDMSGNVWEWVNDWHGSYSGAAQTNPTGPSAGSVRVIRGGGYSDYEAFCRSSMRSFDYPDGFRPFYGFRVVRTAVGAPGLTAVSPASGPVAGGTSITLTGANLTGTTSVTVGGVSATNVQVVSATTVTAVTPPGTAGARDVTVTTPGGTAALEGGFTYATATVPSWATLVEAAPNPEVVTSPTLRAQITATGYAWRVLDTATQIEFVLIPPGTFQMGCSASIQYGCSSDESPVHTVTLTQPFYMGRYEVTQAQWTARMGSNPSEFQSPSAQVPAEQVPSRPVERVSWNAIQGFLSATGMRLPTEAEWEYAYRAGTTTAFHSMPGYPNGTNDDFLSRNIAWFAGHAGGQTRPVGQLAGNGFGLHDMAGSLWEWVNDWYSETYYASSPLVNPPGPSAGSWRVLRGGSWYDYSNFCRSSKRINYGPSSGLIIIGFRVARAP